MGWVYNASPEVESMSKFPDIIAVCIVLTSLMALIVSTRIAVRLQQHRTGLDDYIMAVAMVGTDSRHEDINIWISRLCTLTVL
jgi:hypothetical protein